MDIIKKINKIPDINVVTYSVDKNKEKERENIDFDGRIKTPPISINTLSRKNEKEIIPRCFTDLTEIQTEIDFDKLDEMLNDYASNFTDNEERCCVMQENGCDRKFENEREMYKHLVSECNYFTCRFCSKRLKEEAKIQNSDFKKIENMTTLIDTKDNIYIKKSNNTPNSMISIIENKPNSIEKVASFKVNEDCIIPYDNLATRVYKKGINKNKIKQEFSRNEICKSISFSLVSFKNICFSYDQNYDDIHYNSLIKNTNEYINKVLLYSNHSLKNFNNSLKNLSRINEEDNLIFKPKFSEAIKKNKNMLGKNLLLKSKHFKTGTKNGLMKSMSNITDLTINSFTKKENENDDTCEYHSRIETNKSEPFKEDEFIKITSENNNQNQKVLDQNHIDVLNNNQKNTTKNLFKLITSKINNNNLNNSRNIKHIVPIHTKSKSGIADCLEELKYNEYKEKFHKPSNSSYLINKTFKYDKVNESESKKHKQNISVFDQSLFNNNLNKQFRIFGAKCKGMKSSIYQFQNGKVHSLCVINEFGLGLIGLDDGSLNFINFENAWQSKNISFKPFKIVILENIEIGKINLINEIPMLIKNEKDQNLLVYSFFIAISSFNHKGKIITFKLDIYLNKNSKKSEDPSNHKYNLTKISEANQQKMITSIEIIKTYSLNESNDYFSDISSKPIIDSNGILSFQFNESKAQEQFIKKNHSIIFTNNVGELLEANIFQDSISSLVKENTHFKKIFYFPSLKQLYFSCKKKSINVYKVDFIDGNSLKTKISIGKKQLNHEKIIDSISINSYLQIDMNHLAALNDQNLFVFNCMTMTVLKVITLHSTFTKSKICSALYINTTKHLVFGLTDNSLLFYDFNIDSSSKKNKDDTIDDDDLIEINYEKYKNNIQELKISPNNLNCYKKNKNQDKVIVFNKSQDLLYCYYD